jgi:membrane protein implicated in regulation of membrane protease activity
MRARPPTRSIEQGQMFLVLALLLFLVLPEPWDVVGGLVSLALGIVEITFWQRRMRRVHVQTGVENLIGATGEAATPLAPVGQIRVLGELWQARASSDVPRGAPVRVVALHGLTVDVEPVGSSSLDDVGPQTRL